MEIPHPFFMPYVIKADMQQLFYQSCVYGETEIIKQLLTPPVMDALQPPSSNPSLSYSVLLYNYGIQIACKNHHTPIIKLLLEYAPMKPFVDFTMSNYFAIRTICREGYADILRIILHYYPIENTTQFIQLASQYNHGDIVYLLEIPQLFRVFIGTNDRTKVSIGNKLLAYQDMLTGRQRRHVIRFMSAWLAHIFPRLPKDVIVYLCKL